ncbi:MAG: hypothetical protein CVU99_11745 [Firmicutes bacterium HGW-Firmicutes-4]|nr:MAG: hypothetical protein CVU99_11745 [Firmicutes bacterium HGW-Firmicutes-4]
MTRVTAFDEVEWRFNSKYLFSMDFKYYKKELRKMTEKNTIVKSILINAPYEMVSGFAADNRNWSKWNSNYSNFHYLNGSGEVGSKYELNLSIAGMLYDGISEIETLERMPDLLVQKETFVSKNLDRADDVSTGYIIETIKRTENGTEVTLVHHFDEPFDNHLAIDMVANAMDFGLNNLKLMMENPPSTAERQAAQI